MRPDGAVSLVNKALWVAEMGMAESGFCRVCGMRGEMGLFRRCAALAVFLSFCMPAMRLLPGVGGNLYAEVRTYPVVSDEPESGIWQVKVNGQSVQVLTARTADAPFENYDYGGTYSFVSIDADEQVEFEIEKKRGKDTLANLVLRPASLGLVPEDKQERSFKVKVDHPCRFSVEFDGRRNPLLVFVNPPEKDVPAEGDPNVIWYGPGIHRPEGGIVSLGDGQTLYLAPGAVVHAGIKATGKNITIRGRGILDSSSWPWRRGTTPGVVALFGCENLFLDGIIIRGASRWTVFMKNCDNVRIENLKLCGARVQNDDGVNPCNSRNVSIRNSFFRTDDDCIAIKGLDPADGNCEDITIEGCVFWCDRARISLLGHESRAPYMRRITFRNCDIIHSCARYFLLEPGEEMRLEDVLFEDIRFEIGNPNAESAMDAGYRPDVANIRFDYDVAGMKENWLFAARPAINVYMKTQAPGHIKNLTIRGIKVTGTPEYCGMLFSGYDGEHRFDGLQIEDVQIFGTPVQEDSPSLSIGDFTDRVSVKP